MSAIVNKNKTNEEDESTFYHKNRRNVSFT